jgi:hypothetical protein
MRSSVVFAPSHLPLPIGTVDEDETPVPIESAPVAKKNASARRTKEVTEVEKWRDAVSVSALLPEVKFCFLRLEQLWGEYGTGANIYPKETDLAAALGCTLYAVKKMLRLGRPFITPHATKRRSGRGTSVSVYQLRRPADAKHGCWEGPVRCTAKWLVLKASLAMPRSCST